MKINIELVNKIIDALELGKNSDLNTIVTPEQASHLLWYIRALETEVGMREEQ